MTRQASDWQGDGEAFGEGIEHQLQGVFVES
jgi:hypothetical protein